MGSAFVDAGAGQRSGLVCPAVAQALGVQEMRGQPLLDSLQNPALRAKQLLLVLDNFEHVIAAAPLVADLLRAAPQLTVLVTSRASLHLYGEQEFPVPPLALPDPSALPSPAGLAHSAAVLLFVQRARAVQPDFQSPRQRRPRSQRSASGWTGCRWRSSWPPRAAGCSRLRRCSRASAGLRLLTGGAHDLPARQQTLRATIDWSYQLLDQAEQRLFARLARFHGRLDAGRGRGGV